MQLIDPLVYRLFDSEHTQVALSVYHQNQPERLYRFDRAELSKAFYIPKIVATIFVADPNVSAITLERK